MLMFQLGVTPTSTRSVVSAETPGYVQCPNGVLMRKRADGLDPCSGAPSKVTVTVTKSTQQLCKDAGVPAAQVILCVSNVEQKKMSVADAAKAAIAASQGVGVVAREGRRSVIFPLCQQVGVAEDSLETCYQAVKQGVTGEDQAAILTQIAKQMQDTAAQVQSGQPLPAGTIHYQDPTGIFHVAVPLTATLGGFGQASYIEAGTTQADPTPQGSTAVAPDEYAARVGAAQPLWKKWWFWAIIGGGLATLSGGGYIIYRRRRSNNVART